MLKLTNLKKILLTHWLALFFVALGSWLRFNQLPEKGILFGDSGRDLLAATQAVELKQLPLLGIPSSIPRFRQGPLTIWLSMAIYQIFGFKPIAFYWTFGLIGCLSLLAIYEFSILTLDRKTGLIALGLLAVSPLAVAHSRMPYHTVPIALTTIFALWAITQVIQRKPKSFGLATFAVALVFQHELSLFPLFLAIPLGWWWGGIIKNLTWRDALKISRREISFGLMALTLGLLPQIISEITQNTHQLSGFIIWLGYRFLSFFLPSSEHFGVSTFLIGLKTSLVYWTRVFMIPNGWISTSLMSGLIILSLAGWIKLGQKTKTLKDLSPGVIACLMATILITLGYLMHGAPSEAYFPVYTVLWPLIIAISLTNLSQPFKLISYGWIALIMTFSLIGIYQANFWVDQNQNWNYGPSVGAQLKSLTWAVANTGQTQLILISSDSDAQFEHYLDNYIWLGKSLNLSVASLAGNKPANLDQYQNLINITAQNLTSIQDASIGLHYSYKNFKLRSSLIQPASITQLN